MVDRLKARDAEIIIDGTRLWQGKVNEATLLQVNVEGEYPHVIVIGSKPLVAQEEAK